MFVMSRWGESCSQQFAQEIRRQEEEDGIVAQHCVCCGATAICGHADTMPPMGAYDSKSFQDKPKTPNRPKLIEYVSKWLHQEVTC